MFLVTLVLVLGIATVWFLTRPENTDDDKEIAGSLKLREEQIKQLNQDSDGDGLKNWEEAIFGTDSNNPDTDGDGTKDGDEVAQNRDPLVKGPKDKLSAEALAKRQEDSPYLLPENLTAQLANKFGVRFVAPKLANSPEVLNTEYIGEQIAEEVVLQAPSRLYFAEKEVVLGGNNSKEAVQKYALDLQNSSKPLLTFKKMPLAILSEAIAEDDFSSLAGLDKYLAAYDLTLSNLKKIKTPPVFANFHYRYVNSVFKERDTIQKIRNAETDIVAAIIGAQQNAQVFNRLKDLTTEFFRLYNANL